MFKRNLDKIILVLLLSLYIFLQSNFIMLEPPVWLDEAYLADVAYNILNEGRVGTDIWGDTIIGIKNSFYWYPPVFINTLALWFKMFGFSIFNQRLLSLSLSLVFLIILYILFKNLFKTSPSTKNKLISLGLILFLIFDHTFLKVAKMGRAEIMVAMLGFLSLYIYQIIQNTKYKKMFILLGLLLGLTTMIHLLGFIFFIIILVPIILNQKKIFVKKMFYQFFVAFFIPILIWLISIFPNYSIFINQLSLQSEFRSLVPSYIEAVFRYSSIEQKVIYVIYILLSLISIVSFVKKRGEHSYLAAGLLISWLICFFGKLEWYSFYIVSFLYPLIFIQLFKKRFLLTAFISILLFVLFVFNIKMYLTQYLIYKDKQDAYFQFGEMVKGRISEGKTVYLSTTPDLYFLLKGRNNLYEFPTIQPIQKEYINLLNDSEYIVINFHLERLFVGTLLDRYIELNKHREYSVSTPNFYQAQIIELVPKDKRQVPRL